MNNLLATVRSAAIVMLGAVSTLAPAAHGQSLPAGFTDTLVVAVPAPTAMAFAPDGRVLVTTQSGSLRVAKGGRAAGDPGAQL